MKQHSNSADRRILRELAKRPQHYDTLAEGTGLSRSATIAGNIKNRKEGLVASVFLGPVTVPHRRTIWRLTPLGRQRLEENA